jgi:hypothetical protein
VNRIVTESLGTAAWRAGLADPQLHWKRGRSAWELAVDWESCRDTETGIPQHVAEALDTHSDFQGSRLLLGVAEHSVVLDDSRRPSQNDLWAILRTEVGHVSVAVEAKSGEDFDKPIGDWLGDGSSRKSRRLSFLCETLGLLERPGNHVRYQLIHRAASALLEARRWGFERALLLVQSYGESKTSWTDFDVFGTVMGLTLFRNRVVGPCAACNEKLYVAWVDSPPADDRRAALAV